MKKRIDVRKKVVVLYGLNSNTVAFRFSAGNFSTMIKDNKRKRKLIRR